MRTVDLIARKRDGGSLSNEELAFLIKGYVAGTIPEYQIAAFAMALFFKGMNAPETAALTDAMLKSGREMDLASIPGPFVDKHSTGGVGDKTSLIIAPLVASLGVKVPMMTGRALGHTGGTLDKLDAIPGYQTTLPEPEFRRVLAKDGFAMTGQSEDIAPADRLLYALRDVTATVESIPLITASILSKKAAEGADALVLDVKYGAGAFMKNPSDAEELALSLVNTGTAMGKRVIALLTDMNEPLGAMVGNFLEIEESLDCLEGNGPDDLMELSLALASRMLVLGGKAKSAEEGIALCEAALATGRPRQRFLDNIASQGGDVPRLLAMRGRYRSTCLAEVRAAQDGYLARIDAFKVGQAGVLLGAGRNRTEDTVSPSAGIQFLGKRGFLVKAGTALMTVYARDEKGLAAALPLLSSAVTYSSSPPPKRTLVLKEVSSRE